MVQPHSSSNQSEGLHWLPFTPIRDFAREPKTVARAEGVFYFTAAGDRIIDGSSGLFTTPAGHGRREIADAVHRQLVELDFVSSFQRAHPLADKAAALIARLLPAGIDRIFFANSGSEAVETAMKISLAYHRANGQPSSTTDHIDQIVEILRKTLSRI